MNGEVNERNSKKQNKNSIKIILFINPVKKNALELGEKIKSEMAARNIAVDVYKQQKTEDPKLYKNYDLAVSLGGDGTVLSAAKLVSPAGIPVFPVNLGTFGFIAGIQPDKWLEVFDLWLKGKTLLSRRMMLELIVERKGKEILRGGCLNEVVISYSGTAKIINLNLSFVDENLKKKGKNNLFGLGSYRSDGFIISTPTGSTAHSLAAGGPILDPELEAMILTPICPFSLHSRPMVLPAENMLIVDLDKKQRSDISVTMDGQQSARLLGGDKLYLKKAQYSCMLVASGRMGFFETLAKKFVLSGSVS